MKFTETPLKGSFTFELDELKDERGFFARIFCVNEFNKLGIDSKIVQANNSYNKVKNTLRGMHYQLGVAAETKIVRCIKGALWDVILDIRPDSPTFGHHFGVELNEQNRRSIVVPRGFAHGIFTLADNTEILYFVTSLYSPDKERGIRWNDSYFNIKWPGIPDVISLKDSNHKDFDLETHLA